MKLTAGTIGAEAFPAEASAAAVLQHRRETKCPWWARAARLPNKTLHMQGGSLAAPGLPREEQAARRSLAGGSQIPSTQLVQEAWKRLQLKPAGSQRPACPGMLAGSRLSVLDCTAAKWRCVRLWATLVVRIWGSGCRLFK
eukprot:CAMPEP_0168388566 /NCGR_PEP_ID=MMETSP0228-20121227/16518_1 /TAXON_ID=133427 /ORGANISM="Protoceratium reticulatum, Strain CCCM 535 (=CCMP 1889)" /LENGTH=140 /DNA_ID=CAMNT_0008401819 /DNA_START=10 /DNA_END=433 /DNA_ORIENTATION=-